MVRCCVRALSIRRLQADGRIAAGSRLPPSAREVLAPAWIIAAVERAPSRGNASSATADRRRGPRGRARDRWTSPNVIRRVSREYNCSTSEAGCRRDTPDLHRPPGEPERRMRSKPSGQERARAAEVEPAKPRPGAAERRSVVERHLRLLEEEGERVVHRQLRAAAVEPREIGALGLRHGDAGQLSRHVLGEEVAVGLEVAQEVVEPGWPSR